MKKIMTVYEADPKKFDEMVNTAIAEGWGLEKRTFNQYAFIAELERDILTEEEKTCENCKHYSKSSDQEPCLSCDPERGTCYWEPAEGGEN